MSSSEWTEKALLEGMLFYVNPKSCNNPYEEKVPSFKEKEERILVFFFRKAPVFGVALMSTMMTCNRTSCGGCWTAPR